MSTRKPRGDATLKTLPEERQAEIIEHMRAHKLADTQAWLAEQGLTTSVGSLSGFWSWYNINVRLKFQLKEAASIADELKNVLSGLPQLNLNEEQLNLVAQTAFEVDAVKREDFDQFVALRQLRQRDRKLSLTHEQHSLDRERFELLAAERMLSEALRHRAEEIASSNLSNADKIAAMRKAAFADVDALQASGEVKLPT
jgi:hypothetical protein